MLSWQPKPMADNTTASMEKLTCTDDVDFGKCEDRFERPQKRLQLLRIKKSKFSRKITTKILTSTKSYNWILRFQTIFAVEESAGYCSIKFWERLKFFPQRNTNNVQRHGSTTQTVSQACWRCASSNRQLCEFMLRYNVDKLESSNTEVWIHAGKMEGEKFQRFVYMNYKIDELIYLLDIKNSLHDEIIAN